MGSRIPKPPQMGLPNPGGLAPKTPVGSLVGSRVSLKESPDRKVHPDKEGTIADFQRLQNAREAWKDVVA